MIDQHSNFATLKRMPALDGIRGIAVIMVVVMHFGAASPANFHYFHPGLLGVDIFFVLSGFLITSILLEEWERTGSISLKNFFARRFLRLMPAYWMCLLFLHFVAPHFLTGVEAQAARSNRSLFFALIYMTNWQAVTGEHLGVFSHLWSLAVEEQFYFTWAPFLLLLFVGTKNRRAVVVVTLLLNVLLLNWLEPRIANRSASITATDCRLISLLIGALAGMASFWNIYPREFFSSKYFDLLAAASAITAVVLATRFSLDPFPTFRVLPWFALSVAVFIVWSANRTRSVAHLLLTFPPLVWIGQVSYGLYLWHLFFVVYVRDQPWSLSMKLSVGVAASLIVTTASYYLLERPFLKLKDRFKFTPPALAESNTTTKPQIPTFDSAKETISTIIARPAQSEARTDMMLVDVLQQPVNQ